VSGAIYEETGLWNEALDHYMNSMQICNEIGFQAGKAKVFNNIGKLYFNRQDLKKAEELFRKAISINKELNIKSELFNNYNNLAGVTFFGKSPPGLWILPSSPQPAESEQRLL
jgi:tetratricopeptide (TPR) repeat protein